MEVVETGNRNEVHYKFETLSEYLEIAKKGYEMGIHTSRPSDFNANVSFNGAMEFAKTGWSEGIDKVVTGMSGMVDKLSDINGEDLVPNLCGGAPNYEAVIAGTPDRFLDFEEVEEHRPVLKLGVQFSAQGQYSTQCFTNRGSAMLSLMEVLEMGGIPVELWGYSNTIYDGNPPKIQRMDIKLKASDEPIDTDRIAFVLAHGGFYRQIGFMVKNYFARTKSNGVNEYNTPDNCRSFELADDAFDVLTPYSPNFLRSKADIRKWIFETCEELGVDVEFNH